MIVITIITIVVMIIMVIIKPAGRPFGKGQNNYTFA